MSNIKTVHLSDQKIEHKNDCQMTVEPFYQCCCNCNFHFPVNFHCCTEPKPDKSLHPDSKCCCSVQKGWACFPQDSKEIYDNWPEHSCGCEMYTPKNKTGK